MRSFPSMLEKHHLFLSRDIHTVIRSSSMNYSNVWHGPLRFIYCSNMTCLTLLSSKINVSTSEINLIFKLRRRTIEPSSRHKNQWIAIPGKNVLLQNLSRTGSHSRLHMLLLSKAAHHPVHQQDPHYENSQLFHINTQEINSLPDNSCKDKKRKRRQGATHCLETTGSTLTLRTVSSKSLQGK